MTRGTRDILRRAVQSAVAAAAAYLAVQATGTGEAFLAVISAVLVLQSNRDETLSKAGSRMIGTVIGTAVGLVALAVTRETAIAASLAVVMLVMGAVAAWKPDWRYGVVAAAGLAVGSDAGFLETAQNRGVAIFVGAIVGIAVGSLVWPESARVRARRQMRDALSMCRELLESTLSVALSEERENLQSLHSRFARALSKARDTAESIRLGGKHDANAYCEAVHAIERLWHALIILDRVTETQQSERLPVQSASLEQIRSIQQATCEALACAERFERLPEKDLREIETSCETIWRESRIDTSRDDELQSIALVFGLGEIARNMREVDEAICAIDAAR